MEGKSFFAKSLKKPGTSEKSFMATSERRRPGSDAVPNPSGTGWTGSLTAGLSSFFLLLCRSMMVNEQVDDSLLS